MNASPYSGGDDPTLEYITAFGNPGPLNPVLNPVDINQIFSDLQRDALHSDSSLITELGTVQGSSQTQPSHADSQSNSVSNECWNNTPSSSRTSLHINSGVDTSNIQIGPPQSKLELLLRKYSDGKIIKRSFKLNNGFLNDTIRKLLVHLIIQHELNQALAILSDDGTEKLADFPISSDTFISYTKDITKLFPTEDAATYFNGFKSVDGVRLLAHGKLWDHYNYIKSILREQGVLEVRKAKQKRFDKPIIDPSESIKSQLEWLKIHSEPLEQLLDSWRSTREARRQILLTQEKPISEYFSEFLALRLQVGSTLLKCDFDQLWPNKQSLLFDTWDVVKSHLIFKLKGAKNIKAHEDKAYVHLLTSLPAGQQDCIIFFLLPYLIPSDRAKCRKRKINAVKGASKENTPRDVEEIRKLSLNERRESFTLRVPTAADINTALDKKKEDLRTRGLRFQPTPVIVGTISDVQASYVAVDDIIYNTPSYLHAIDLTFKIFFATNCQYPEQASSLWLFIQKGIYNIEPPTEKYPVAVNALAGELKQVISQSRNSSE